MSAGNPTFSFGRENRVPEGAWPVSPSWHLGGETAMTGHREIDAVMATMAGQTVGLPTSFDSDVRAEFPRSPIEGS